MYKWTRRRIKTSMITEASAVRTEKHGKDPLTHFLIDIFVLACCSDFSAWDHHQLWENSAEKGWSSESSGGLSCPFQSSQLTFGPHRHPALVSNPSATKLPLWGPWVRPFNARLRSWVQLKCKSLWHRVQVSASTGGRNQVRWIESEITAEGCWRLWLPSAMVSLWRGNQGETCVAYMRLNTSWSAGCSWFPFKQLRENRK